MTLHNTTATKRPDEPLEGEADDLKGAASFKAVATALQRAQMSCQKGHWADVIAECEAAIAHCQTQLNSPMPAQAISNSIQAEPTPANPIQAAPNQAEPTKADLYQAKGDLFASQGQIDAAIEAYQQAVDGLPQNAALVAKLASLYARQQQWDRAIAQYQQALTLDPSLSDARNEWAEAYAKQAEALKQKGDIAGAVRAYLQALQQQPRLFAAYSRLRYNLMRYDLPEGDPLFQEIAHVCQAIVQQQPTLLPAQVALGYALTKAGKRSDAIACFNQVSEQTTSRQLSNSQSDQPSIAQSPTQRRAPDFIVIGAEKCGTTSVYQYLRQHPAVLPPIEKEIDFFDLEYEQGIEWYLAHFPAVPDKSGFITGETSANYLYDNQAPARIFEHFPQIKLAVILRHPIDRTLSRYSMMVRNGAEKRSFETAISEEIALIEQATTAEGEIPWPVLNRCRHVGNSLYHAHLKRWLAVFPRQQLLVLQTEALLSQPEPTLKQLYEMFGIAHYTEQTYSKYNVGSYKPLAEAIRKPLADFFAPHNRKLEALLNQSFGWDSLPLEIAGDKQ